MTSATEPPPSPERKPDLKAEITPPPDEPAPPSKRKRDVSDEKPDVHEDEKFAAFAARFEDNVKEVDDHLEAKTDSLVPINSHGDDFDKFYGKLRVTRSGLPTDPWALPSSVKLAEVIAMYLAWLVENATDMPVSVKTSTDTLQGWAKAMVELVKFKVIPRGHHEAWWGVRKDGSDSLEHLIMRVWSPIVEQKLILPRDAQPEDADPQDQPFLKRVRYDETQDRKDEVKDEIKEDNRTQTLTSAGFWATIDQAWSAVIADGPLIPRAGLLSPHATERKEAAAAHEANMKAMVDALWKTLQTLSVARLEEWGRHLRAAMDQLYNKKLYEALEANVKEPLDEKAFRHARCFVVAAGKSYFEAVKASPELAVREMFELRFHTVAFRILQSLRGPQYPMFSS